MRRSWLKWLLLAAALIAAVVLVVIHYKEVMALLRDPEQVRAWLAGLGPIGPLGLIALNAAQVVVAPIPGYVVQIAAGYLFGWLLGSIYGAIGMVLGGIIAMNLGRIFGRPLVRRVVGTDRLERWEHITHLDSLWVWCILMLGPLGDAPYYIAGLTTLPIWRIAVVVLLVRSPSVIVAAAIGAGVISWKSPWVIGGLIFFVVFALVAARYQDRLDRWLDERILGPLAARAQSRAGRKKPIPAPAAEEHSPSE